MTMRKTLAAAGLVLAVAILSPAAAMADAKGTNRPANGTGSGTVSVDVAKGAFTAEIAGFVSTLGRVTVHTEGVGELTDGRFVGTGVATITTPNGDQVTGDVALSTTELTPTGHTTTVVIRITGGTGRFADAAGTLTVVCDTGPPVPLTETLVQSRLECTVEGRISY
jgi:hypothetical protein